MMNEFRFYLSRNKVQLLAWGLGLALYAGYIVSFYDNLLAMGEQFEAILESYPPELLALVGGMSDMFSPAGFLHTYFFSLMPLMVGIFAILAGSGLLVSDEEGGRLDLVLGQPISRTTLFTARLLGLLIGTSGLMGLSWAAAAIGMAGSSLELELAALASPFLSLLALLIFLESLALVLSLLLPSRRAAAALAGLVLVAGFVLTMMGQLNQGLSGVARLSPLTYYQGGLAINGMAWDWFAGLLISGLLLSGLAWWRFRRRDIRVAGEAGWQWPLFRRPKDGQPKERLNPETA